MTASITEPQQQPSQHSIQTVSYTINDLTLGEKQLMDLLSKRQELNANLIHIENSIYNLETVYIEDTNYGNVVRGYEGFLNSRAGHRKRSIESERIFSQSSVNVRRNDRDDAEREEKKQIRVKKRVVYSDED